MHILWLIPDYLSFLKEELLALAPRLGRLSVISPGVPPAAEELPGVQCVTIPIDRPNPVRLAKRARGVVLAAARGGAIMRQHDWPKLRRLARHNEIIQDYVLAERVDVIHSHFAVPEGTAGWQAAAGRPVVLTVRGEDILTLPDVGYGCMLDAYYARNLRRAIGHMAVVTAASRCSFDATRRLCNDERKLRLVPNGVDVTRFRRSAPGQAELLARLGLQGRRVVAAAGNLGPRKGFGDLVSATKAVANDTPGLAVVIAGDGPERESLQRQIDDAGLRTFIHMPGRLSRDEIAALFALADIFVHPSLLEGFGNVVLEAMACGTAVIATQTGAAADLIRHGESGLLVRCGDPTAIAESVASLLADPSLREHLGESALRVAANHFPLTRRVECFVALYEEVMNQQQRMLAHSCQSKS